MIGVLVQGDLARSPRMLNHCRMLINIGKKVLLVGYLETDLPSDLIENI